MSGRFIGVDSGTQGTRAVVIDGGSGKVLGQASAPHASVPNLKGGAREQDPAVWVAALEKSVRGAIKASNSRPEQIKALAIAGQQHGFVPLDEKGQVIRPAKLWNDTSTQPQAEAILRKAGGLEAFVALTGNGLPAGFTAPKILWLRQHEPRNYGKLASVLLPHDYLNFVLTGRKVTEAGDASGTGLFDVKTRNWEPRAIAAVDPLLADKLPPVQAAHEPAGGLTLVAARRLGLAPGTLVAGGGGDNMMAAIGTGNTKPGVVTASLGTSGTIHAFSSRPIIDPEGEIAAFCDSTGSWLPLVCTMNVGGVTEAVRKAFRWDNEALTRQAASVSAGSDGLMLLPYLAGERVPNLPRGKGVFFGIDAGNFTGAHMARAAMEGVAFGLNHGLNRLRDLGVRPKQIRLTGGAAANPLWRQILADVFDAEVVCVKAAEGAAYGAAIQACWCHALQNGEKLRIQQLTDAFVKLDAPTRCAPKKDRVRLYRELQELHEELARANAPMFGRGEG